jgi:hypothetical protein
MPGFNCSIGQTKPGLIIVINNRIGVTSPIINVAFEFELIYWQEVKVSGMVNR